MLTHYRVAVLEFASELILFVQVKDRDLVDGSRRWFKMTLAASGIRQMVIELVLLFAFAVAVGFAVVKVIEWRMDVFTDNTSPLARVEQKRRG